MRPLSPKAARIAWFAPLALIASTLAACGGDSGGSPPSGTIQGTAAVGAPLANAQIQVSCKNGTSNVSTNANGAYSSQFTFDPPCELIATSGNTLLHSFAAGPGTYNITPLTELLLVYLAGQLNTTLDGLLAGITANPTYQSALTNSTVIANAERGVATLVQQTYGVTLSTSSFLTTAFTPGQPLDQALDALQSKGALQANGQPVPTLVSDTYAAGQTAGPIGGGNSGGATGGTGGTGLTGTATQ
jgi:hypothetical protein